MVRGRNGRHEDAEVKQAMCLLDSNGIEMLREVKKLYGKCTPFPFENSLCPGSGYVKIEEQLEKMHIHCLYVLVDLPHYCYCFLLRNGLFTKGERHERDIYW